MKYAAILTTGLSVASILFWAFTGVTPWVAAPSPSNRELVIVLLHAFGLVAYPAYFLTGDVR